MPFRHKVCLAVAVLGSGLLAAAIAPFVSLRPERKTGTQPTQRVDPLQCGHWAVYRTCELLGVPLTPKRVLDKLPRRIEGHTLKELVDFLHGVGLNTQAKRERFETFMGEQGVRLVHLAAPDHYVVVDRTVGERVYFFDDVGRHQHMNASVLKRRWTGNVVQVSRAPSEDLPNLPGSAILKDKPCARWSTLFIDHGDIPLTSTKHTVEYRYALHNAGQVPLLVTGIRTDCDCILASKPSLSVPPGGMEDIVLHYAVTRREREFVHEAVVRTNDPTHPMVVLRAAGNVDTLVRVEPNELNLGEVPLGGAKRCFLLVKYTGEATLALDSVHCDLPGVLVTEKSFRDPEVIGRLWPSSHGQVDVQSGTFILQVLYSPENEGSTERQGLITLHTNIPRFERIVVPIRARPIVPVAAVPPSLVLGDWSPGMIVERRVSLVSLTGEPFAVVSVESSEAGMEAAVDTKGTPVRKADMRLTGTGASLCSARGATLHVVVSQGEKRFRIDVPVHVFNVQAPEASRSK